MGKIAHLAAIGILCVAAEPSLAQIAGFDAQSYYAGKTVTIQVGFRRGISPPTGPTSCRGTPVSG